MRQRGSLTVWLTDKVIAARAAVARTTRGDQPRQAPLAILTALTLCAVFRPAHGQARGLIGSVIGLLSLALRVPNHAILSRRAATPEVPRPWSGSTDAGGDTRVMRRLVDSTGLKLCGAGKWVLRDTERRHAGRGGSCISAWTRHRPDRGFHTDRPRSGRCSPKLGLCSTK